MTLSCLGNCGKRSSAHEKEKMLGPVTRIEYNIILSCIPAFGLILGAPEEQSYLIQSVSIGVGILLGIIASALWFLFFKRIISKPHVLKNWAEESVQRQFKEIEISVDELASIRPLLAGVVHQINNPLSNIRLAGEVLLEELDEVVTEDEAFKKFHKHKLTGIISEVDRARKLMRELNQLAERKILNRNSLNLTEIINRAIHSLRPHIPPEIELITSLEDHIQISGDNQMMTTAAVNLISFAVQSIEGEGTVVVMTQVAEDGMVELSVTDSGKTIPEQDLGRVFEPFFASKESGRKAHLGLFVAYDIVRRHNGMMWAVNTVGKGISLRVKLPAKELSR